MVPYNQQLGYPTTNTSRALMAPPPASTANNPYLMRQGAQIAPQTQPIPAPVPAVNNTYSASLGYPTTGGTAQQPMSNLGTQSSVNRSYMTPVAPQAQPVTLPTTYTNPQVINPQDANQPAMQAPPTGLIGSELALSGGFTGALNSMTGGAASAEQILGQTAQQGQVAADRQAALVDPNSGASYSQSPAARYQMEQMQRAVERSAAARGGLLGGNTLRALQENAAGIASQDAQQQFNNTGVVTDRGTQLQSRIADLRNNLGLNQGQLFTQTGDRLASGRTNAGLAIAQNVSNTSSGISNLLSQQGIQVSQQFGNQINTISNLLHESGMGDKADNAQLAAILANIAGGAGSTVERGNTAIGDAQVAGIYGTNSAIQTGLTKAIKFGEFSSTPNNNSSVLGASQNGYTDQYAPY